MIMAICELCGQKKELVNSHVWPRFAYKDFVANLKRGGQFIDLHKRETHAHKQYTRLWFCSDCDTNLLGPSEKYAAEFCKKMARNPTNPQMYGQEMLMFATSISWRTMKLWRERPRNIADETAKKASKQWKEFLRGKKRQLGPYTQHLFIIYDQQPGFHLGLGGCVFPEEKLVFSQIGPLFIIGLLDRRHITTDDLDIWRHSLIDENGGSITPISEWRVGKSVTLQLTHFLVRHEREITRRILSLPI